MSIKAPHIPIAPYSGMRQPKAAAYGLDQRATLISRFAGFLGLISSPAWGWALFYSIKYPMAVDYFIVAVVMTAGLSFVLFASRNDAILREIMLSGLLLKFAAGSIYIYVVYRVYEAGADLAAYNTSGYLLAFDFTTTGRWPIVEPLVGGNFVKFVVAMLYLLFGPSLPGAASVYMMMAFIGQYLLYRSFCIAYPMGDKRTAALFMFLLPSILYWPSSLGKDCQSLLALGMVTYGLAFISRKIGFRGYILFGLGLLLVFFVRPHIAGILAITSVFPYIFGKSQTGLWGGILKIAAAPLLLALVFVLVQQGEEFVDFSANAGAEGTLNKVASNNATSGKSSFNTSASVPARIAMSPFLMFRPFPWEARNLQSLIASAEGLFLLIFTWKQRHWFVAALRRIRKDSFAAYAAAYTIIFSVLFAGAMTNFGLLARQRVMLLPIVLMLFIAVDVRTPAPAPRTIKNFAGWVRNAGGRRGGSRSRWATR